jgi:hypothetical protein
MNVGFHSDVLNLVLSQESWRLSSKFNCFSTTL